MNHLQVIIDHQKWRRGETENAQHTSVEIGKALDACISEIITARKCAVMQAGRLLRIEKGLAETVKLTGKKKS